MEYYTSFTLTVASENAKEIIAALRAECSNADYALDENGEPNDSTKWYDRDKDMKAFSLKYPDVLFKLNGEGEESGDIWNTYYKNGKSQTCQAIITFEPFDESKLK